jgi:hypothetical protein
MTEGGSSRRLNLEAPIVVLFILILAWAPFPYGSNRPWAVNVLGLVLGALVILWAAAVIFGYARLTPLTGKLVLPIVCLGAALGFALLQALDLTSVDHLFGGAGFASLLSHPVWTMASQAFAGPSAAYISVDPRGPVRHSRGRWSASAPLSSPSKPDAMRARRAFYCKRRLRSDVRMQRWDLQNSS